MTPLSPSRSKPVLCFCGSKALLQSNSIKYGREYGNGKAWICERFPECEGYVGTHPDGSPLGTLADNQTVKLRRELHSIIDPLWMSRTDRSKKKNRGSVYGWLRRIMNMTPDECHVGNWDAETCIEALEQIARHPYQEKYTGASL